MKALELISQLQKAVDKHGVDFDVLLGIEINDKQHYACLSEISVPVRIMNGNFDNPVPRNYLYLLSEGF
jgi:hypothetical protein